MDKNIGLFMRKLREMPDFHRVKFVILYGSRAGDRATKISDYDFAVYYGGGRSQKYKFLIDMNFSEKFDVKIFQDLPLFIRKDVLKGKVIYTEDIDFVYDIAYQTIKEFERFKKHYYDYIRKRPIIR